MRSTNNLDTLLQSAYQHSLAGRYSEAIEDYKAVLRLDPNNVNAHYDLHLAYKKMNLLQLALEEVEEAARLSPSDDEICFGRALLYDTLGSKSISEIQQMVNHLPENMANAQILLGSLAEKQRNYQKALVHFENALRQQPDAVSIRGHLGKALLHLGRDVEARQALLAATQEAGVRPVDWYYLAVAETRQRDYAGAAAALERALAQDENYERAWIFLSTTEVRRRRWRSAWRAFQQFMKRHPLMSL